MDTCDQQVDYPLNPIHRSTSAEVTAMDTGALPGAILAIAAAQPLPRSRPWTQILPRCRLIASAIRYTSAEVTAMDTWSFS